MGCCSYIHSFVGAFESLWLPEQARWVHLACSGFSASVLQERVFFPLLIKLGWINMSYIGLILLIVFSVVDPGEGPGGGGGFAPFFRPN